MSRTDLILAAIAGELTRQRAALDLLPPGNWSIQLTVKLHRDGEEAVRDVIFSALSAR